MKGKDIVWPGEKKKASMAKKRVVTSSSVGSGTKSSKLDKEINLTIKPKQILRVFAFVILLMGVFFLGRFSVSGDFDLSFATGNLGGLATADNNALEVNADVKSGIDSGSEAKLDVAKEDVKAEAKEETKEEPKKEEVKEAVKEEPKVEAPENDILITDYNNVVLALDKANVKWMETWGKIQSIEISLKNGERGRVEPSYMIMNVRGYDLEKRIPLPSGLKTVKRGTTLKAKITVPSGFAYSELTAGNLGSVPITLVMYDAGGKEMATLEKAVSLMG